jgi:hypothetical protein
VDDHLTTVMFLDRQKKTLDYNFLLWKFQTSSLDVRTLTRLDQQKPPEKEPEVDPEFADVDLKLKCCIF